MSEYYTPQRSKNIFDPASSKPFPLSRSKLDLFLNCPLCFYLDRRLGVGRPPGFPFSLNAAVDALLKKEFDIHRANGNKHPLMEQFGIDAIPFNHPEMNVWRDALRGGITHHDPATNFLVAGGIDDLWVNPKGELLVVDYKATAKSSEVTLDAPWQVGYKRQVEVYQWLFKKNGFPVSSLAYFVYCNGDADRKAFDGKLEFRVTMIPYKGDDSWVNQALINAHDCLVSSAPPAMSPDCDFCRYRDAVKIYHI